jgi:ribosome-associated protein
VGVVRAAEAGLVSCVIRVSPTVTIDESEVEERFVRASGPGGQNVNKVASAVELRFDAARSPALNPDVLQRLRAIAGARMTDEGVIVIDARRHRTQHQNREDARARLAALIQAALVKPKKRRRTRPTAASKERRIERKRQRSHLKRGRGKIRDET